MGTGLENFGNSGDVEEGGIPTLEDALANYDGNTVFKEKINGIQEVDPDELRNIGNQGGAYDVIVDRSTGGEILLPAGATPENIASKIKMLARTRGRKADNFAVEGRTELPKELEN